MNFVMRRRGYALAKKICKEDKGMTREEAIEYGTGWLKDEYLDAKDRAFIKTALEVLKQEPCEDEYIKVPKKALKYRTAGMVAYNAEWLKNHFDMERVVICGAQEPCEDCISRREVLNILLWEQGEMKQIQMIKELPSVIPEQPVMTGEWVTTTAQAESEGEE